MSPQQPTSPFQPSASAPLIHIERLPSTTTGRRRSNLPWIAGSLSGAVLLCGGISIAIGVSTDGNTTPGVTASSTVTGAPSGSTGPPGSAAPAAPTVAPPKAKPKPKPTYRTLGEREWKLIAKNPNTYVGKTYLVYGAVTQFDAATGDDTFRADVGHRNMAESYEYDTNTLLTGSPARLRNVVQDDEFRASVTVLGSFSYDTQIGGSTTVPQLRVDAIKIL